MLACCNPLYSWYMKGKETKKLPYIVLQNSIITNLEKILVLRLGTLNIGENSWRKQAKERKMKKVKKVGKAYPKKLFLQQMQIHFLWKHNSIYTIQPNLAKK